jgi:hypothetical protein
MYKTASVGQYRISYGSEAAFAFVNMEHKAEFAVFLTWFGYPRANIVNLSRQRLEELVGELPNTSSPDYVSKSIKNGMSVSVAIRPGSDHGLDVYTAYITIDSQGFIRWPDSESSGT